MIKIEEEMACIHESDSLMGAQTINLKKIEKVKR